MCGPSVAPSSPAKLPVARPSGLSVLSVQSVQSGCLSVTVTPRQGQYSCDPRTLLFLSSLAASIFLYHPSPTIASPSRRDVYYTKGRRAATTCQLCIVRHGSHVFVKFHCLPFFFSVLLFVHILVIAPLASPTLAGDDAHDPSKVFHA